MQLELDEQVHQYDADTWGAQSKYLGQIHPRSQDADAKKKKKTLASS